MFDGSMLPYDENVELTSRVVKLAQPHGVSVEAELGCVAGKKITGEDIGDNVLTRPEEVVDFAKATGVDALAVSIGTSHGVYVSRPELDIDRLKAINAVSPIPLVLHGGSGTPKDQVQEAIRSGITKLNVYADTRLAINGAFSESMAIIARRPDELSDVVFKPLHDAIVNLVTAKIDVTMSGGAVA
jgi:fructose-bisphosphate aldolase class II